MGFDRALTLFNPEGELLQVNYARKSVDNGRPTMAMVGKDSVVFVALRPVEDSDIPLIVPESAEKVFKIDNNIAAAISGFISDGRVLIDKLQELAQQYRVLYDKEADILMLVKDIAFEMQAYTQYGGARPFAVGLLIGGLRDNEPALYMIEPGGTYYSYKAIAIGMEKEKINRILKAEYKEGMSSDELVKLGIKALKSTSTKITTDNTEIAIVKKDKFEKLSTEELSKLI